MSRPFNAHRTCLAAGSEQGFDAQHAPADFHAVFGPSPAGIEPYIQWVIGSLNLTGDFGWCWCSMPLGLCWAVNEPAGACIWRLHSVASRLPLAEAGPPIPEPGHSLCPAGYTVLDFYRDERVKLLYRHNLCHIANRASSLTGVKYKDDPTIFSWDLVNEPRSVVLSRELAC